MFDDLRRVVPEQIRRSYAAKFGIVLLVIGISVGLIGSAGTILITDEVQAGVNDDLQTFAVQEAGTTEEWVDRNKETTLLVSRSDALQGDQLTVSDYLTSQRDQLQGQQELTVVNLDDASIVASTWYSANESRQEDYSDTPWVQRLEELQTRNESLVITTDVYRQPGSETTVMAFATRIGFTQRALIVTYPVSNLADRYQGANRTEGGFTMVVNPDENRVLFDERGANTSMGEYQGQQALEEASNIVGTQKTTVIQVESNSVLAESHVVAIAAVPGTDWVVLVHAPQSAAYGFVSTVSQFGLLATVAGVLLITVLGAVLGRNTATAIDRLTAKTQRMEEGDLSVDFETKRIDNIGRLYGAFGSMRNALRDQIQEAQQARQEAEQAREQAEMMNRHLVEKAGDYSDVMQSVADGDLTHRMDAESRNEAMEEIAVEFNQMIDEIEQTMETVKAFSTEVATSSEEVTASSEEVKSASEQVTESIQEISDGADHQNQQLQQVSEEMSGLSTTIEEIASSANEVADLSERTAETGDDARANAEQAIVEMEEVEREAGETVDEMNQLQDQMEEIEEITEFITDVAEQTNILALNANIEAARAGEAGEGFAVVADEVKGLAEETRQAAGEIEVLVEDIQGQTQETAREVQETVDEVARSVEIVEETVESLEEIAGYAEETNTGIQEISDATTEQASSTNQVVGMVDEAASIAEQTSRESENVAAAAEEQTTALTEVTDSASDLAEQASRLSTALERFQTKSETPSDADSSFGDGAGDPERRGGSATFTIEDESGPETAAVEEKDTSGDSPVVSDESGGDGELGQTDVQSPVTGREDPEYDPDVEELEEEVEDTDLDVEEFGADVVRDMLDGDDVTDSPSEAPKSDDVISDEADSAGEEPEGSVITSDGEVESVDVDFVEEGADALDSPEVDESARGELDGGPTEEGSLSESTRSDDTDVEEDGHEGKESESVDTESGTGSAMDAEAVSSSDASSEGPDDQEGAVEEWLEAQDEAAADVPDDISTPEQDDEN